MRKPSFLEARETLNSKPGSACARFYSSTKLTTLILASVFAAQSFAGEAPALKAQTQAYITLVHADEALELEKWKEAGRHYSKALKEYKQIQSAHPDFNSEIISYRVAYCQNQLNLMVKKVQDTLETDSSASLLESKYLAARQENTYLRNRLEELEEQLSQANDPTELNQTIERLKLQLSQVKGGQNKEEVSLRSDLQRAREEADHFRAEVDRQKTVLAELKVIAAEHEQSRLRNREQDAEIERLAAANQNLTRRLNQAQKDAQIKQQAQSSDSDQLQAAFKEIQTKLTNEQNINRQLIEQVAAADQRVRELNESSETKSRELTQFGQQIATLLGRENEAATTISEQKTELEALRKQYAALKEKHASSVPRKEFQTMKADMEALSERWKQSTQDLQTAKKSNQALLEQNKALNEDLRTTQVNIEQATGNEIKILREEIEVLTRRNASLEQDLETSKSREGDPESMKNLEDSVAALEEERKTLTRQIQNLGKELEQSREKEADPETAKARDIALKKNEDLEKALRDSEEEQKKLNNVIKDLTIKAEHADQAGKLEQTNRDLVAEIDELRSAGLKQLADSEKDIAKKDQVIQELSGEVDRLRETEAENKKEMTETTQELHALSSRNAQIQNELERMAQTNHELSAKENELNDQLTRSRSEWKNSQDSAQKLEKEVRTLSASLNTLQAENGKLKGDLQDSLKALDSVQAAMEKTINSRTTPIQTEMDRLIEEVAELKSYQESVGSISPGELAQMHKELASLKDQPAPAEEHTQEEPQAEPPLETMLREAQAREREQSLEEASALYKRILQVAPEQYDARKGLSRIHLQLNQPERVQPLLDQVLKENKKDTEALLLLGLAQYKVEDYREASKTLKKLVKTEGENPQGWNAFGAALMAQKNFREARQSFERALSLDPNLGDAHYNLAQVLRIYSPKEIDVIRIHYSTARSLGSAADMDMEDFLKTP